MLLLIDTFNKISVKKLYEEFFDYISHDYENLIDLKRNQENICNLLKIIQKYYNNDIQLVILDYGCGTGISYNIAKKLQIKIFGFDTCPNMRSNSLEKGMVVWKKEIFNSNLSLQ